MSNWIVGQKVYVVDRYGHYCAGSVTSITPSGKINVSGVYPANGIAWKEQFNAEGRIKYDKWIDEAPFEKRTAWLAEITERLPVEPLFRKFEKIQTLQRRWGHFEPPSKPAMLDKLAEYDSLLAEIRAAVNALGEPTEL